MPDKQKPFLKGDLHPMAKIIPIDEHFQHFLTELKESFWGDLYGQTALAGSGFSNWSQSVSAIAFRAGRRMSGGVARGGDTAMATTREIS